ncbi:MAG: hypothetical protein HYV06_03650 [Deltaproteobacteria bacterium]|nr:hypothetical protein [Deltaproteobacteria bacterium]
MPHDKNKERQEISLIGRILSMEALILLMGCLSLIYGVIKGEMMSIFWGALILCAFLALLKVRKKDWKKHWEELEAEQKAREERKKRNSPGNGPGEK